MKRRVELIGASVLMLCAGITQSAPDTLSKTEASKVLAQGKEALAQDPSLEWIPGQVLVRFKTNDDRLNNAAKALVNGRLIRTLKGVDRLEHLEVGLSVERAVEMLNALPFVEYAEPDYVQRTTAVPNDQFVSLQWGVNNTGQDIRGVFGTNDVDIDGYEAWDTRTSAASMIVAIIDSGTQWDHPDLDDNIWVNAGEIANNGVDDDNNGYVDDVRGWDFFSNDNNPTDLQDGHGTHTAGTVGAEGNNGIGVAGVAWDVQLMPLRFLGTNGGSTSDAILAINYAVANGSQLSNNSWGGGPFSNSLFNAISSAAANDHLFVAAAGNDLEDTDVFPHYPSSYTLGNIISVAAIDNQGALSIFPSVSSPGSNYGATSVDLGAPGSDIASTYPTDTYVWNSGTSMAAPHVAGAAAIVWAENPGWTYAQVRDQIFNTVDANAAMNGITVLGGVLNLDAALAGGGGGPVNTAPTASINSPSNGASFTEGDSVSFSGSASDNEDGNINASLVWTSNLDGQIGAGASFSTTGLSVGSHTITASVNDSGGLSDSDSVSITIDPDQPAVTPPATPGRPVVSNLGGGSAQVTWADNSDNETSFEVRREQRVGRQWVSTTTVASVGQNVTSYIDNPGNGRWRYSVRAVNSAGASSWSSWRTVRVR